MNKGTLLLLFIFIFSINIISIKAEENENPNSILKQEENKGFGAKVWDKIKEFFKKVIEFIKTKTGLIIVISVSSAILLLILTIILYKVIKHKKEKDDIPYINFYDSSKNPNLKLYDKSLNNISIPSDSNSKESENSVPFQAHFKQNTFMNTPVQGNESYSPVVPPNYNSSSSNTNLFNKYGSNPRINNLEIPSPTSYDNLNKGRPEPQNIFDGGFYPNRSSSLLGEDDIKRLNGIMNDKDENSNTVINEEKSNIKPNNVENKIDFESIPDEFKDLKTYRVVHKFKPHRDDELMVEKNHLLKVIKTFEDGWALCYSINNRDKGFIPMNKLKLDDEKPNESENEQNGALTRTSTDNTLNTLGSNTASTKEIISSIMNIKKMDDFEIKQGSDINEITNKLSPSSEQDKLTFKYDEGEEENEEHRIIIEDNTLSHDNSCHVVFDYTDTTANSFINYPSLGIQYDSQQQYSQSSQDYGIDTYLNVRKSFVPTKSKLHSMEIGNDITTDDSIDNINYYINNSIINNSSSFSQQSVQNLSLSRQLFTATPSGLNPKRHKRSSSQPTPYSEEEFDVVPKQNKNSSLGRLRSKSNGRLETEYDNRRRNVYPAGNMDVKITNDVRYGPTPGRFDNFLRNQRAVENNGKINEEEKRTNFFANDPRRLSDNNNEEIASNSNFNSEPRKRSVIIENDNVYYVNDMMPAKALRAREDANLPRYRDERPSVNPVVYRNIMKSLGNANGLRGNIRPSPMAVNVDNYRGPGNMRSPYRDDINPNIQQAAIMEQRAYIQQAPLMEQRAYIQQSPLMEQRQFIQQRPIEQRPYSGRSDIEDSTLNSVRSEPRTPRNSEPRTPRTPRNSEPRTPRTPKSPYTSYNSSYYPESVKSKSSNTSLKRDNPKSPYIVNNPGYRSDNTISYEQY